MVHLLSLPLEILGIICSNFCRHCTHEPKDPKEFKELTGHDKSLFNGATAYSVDDGRIKTATLYATMQTCTALRDIAQPYLYHFPCARGPALAKLLHRTLVERPDLSRYIYQLSVFNLECWNLEGYLRLMLRIPRYQDCGEELTRKHMRNCIKYHNPMREGRRVDIKFSVNTLFTTLVLPFGTSIQTLHLELDDNKKFSSCEPGSLPRLKELIVKDWGEYINPIKVIASILIAAPALERLGGVDFRLEKWKWEGPRIPIHEGVKEVLFETCVLGPRVVGVLLSLFPRLEAFTYESNTENLSSYLEEASLPQFGKALLACPDLRFLSLDFASSMNILNDPTEHLVQLKKLQKFRVKGLGLYHEPHYTGPIQPRIKICDMLPASITELEVTSPHNDIFDDMLELSAVASQKVPLLKHVSITGIEQEWEVGDWRQRACMGLARINELREAFGQSGIELLSGDFGKYRSWMI